jgi:hypothetical protein
VSDDENDLLGASAMVEVSVLPIDGADEPSDADTLCGNAAAAADDDDDDDDD